MDALIAAATTEGQSWGTGASSAGRRRISAQSETLFNAIRQGKIRIISNLIETGCDVNVQNNSLRTPLMQAVFVQKDDVRTHIVRMLLGRGCDINMQDEDGRTALMLAAFESNRDDVVRRIVSTGKCDPNVKDFKGDNALIYAVYGGNASVIRILVNTSHTKGIIDVDAANNDRINPLKLAFKLRQEECVRVLVEEGGARVTVIKDRDGLNNILHRGNGNLTTRGIPLRPDTGGLTRANTNNRPRQDPFGDLLATTSTAQYADTDMDPLGDSRKKVKRYKKKKSKRATTAVENDSDEMDSASLPLGPLTITSGMAPQNTSRSLVSYSREASMSRSSSKTLHADSYFRDMPTSQSNYSSHSKNKRLTPLAAHAESMPFSPRTPRHFDPSGTPEANATHHGRTGTGTAGLWSWSTSDEYDMTSTAIGTRDHPGESKSRMRRKKKTKARLSPLHSGYSRTTSRFFPDEPGPTAPSKGTLLPAIPSAGRKVNLIGSPEVYNSFNF